MNLNPGHWIPSDFEIPEVVWRDEFRIRPLRIEDVDTDYECYMSCAEHVRTGGFIQPGDGSHFDWPRPDNTRRWALVLLGHAEFAMETGTAVEYGIFDLAETKEFGCVYLRPTHKSGYDAAVTFWVREDHYSELDSQLEAFCREWVPAAFPFFEAIAFPGRDISWDEWAKRR